MSWRYCSVSLKSSESCGYTLQLLPFLPWVYFILVPSSELTTWSSHICILHAGLSLYILIFRLSLIHVSFTTPNCRVLVTYCLSQLPLWIHCCPLNILQYSLLSILSGPAGRLVHLKALGEKANLMRLSGSLFGHLILIMHVRLNLKCN